MRSLLTVQQAAERLGVSFWTVYRLARAGRLASIQLGRRRLISEEDIEEFVRSSRVTGGTHGRNKCTPASSQRCHGPSAMDGTESPNEREEGSGS